MQGKILGFKNARGTIRGEDGKRYKFGVSEVQNAQDIDIETLSGSEVDFEVDGSEAVEIFVTKFSSTNFSSNFAKNTAKIVKEIKHRFAYSPTANAALIKEIKHRFAIYFAILIGVILLSIIPMSIANMVNHEYGAAAGTIFQVVFFVIYFTLFARLTDSIKKKAKSAYLLANFVKSEIIPFLAVFAAVALAVSTRESHHYSEESSVWAAIILSVGLIAGFIANLFFKYKYYKELAQITAQPLFLYAFWCNVVIILCPIGFVLWLVAWFSFKEFNESESKNLYLKAQSESKNKNPYLKAQSEVEPLVMDFYEQLKNGNANEEFSTQKARQIAEMVMKFENLDSDHKLKTAWMKIGPLWLYEIEIYKNALKKFDDKIREFIKEMSK